MTDFEWPDDLAPFTMEFYLQAHSGGSESPFSRQSKIYGLSAPRWMARMQFRGGYDGEEGLKEIGQRLDGFLARLRGRQNRVSVYDFRRTWKGEAGLTNGAALRGATLLPVTGGTPFGTIAKRGDYFGVPDRAHIITKNAVADASGAALIEFEPPLSRGVAAGVVTWGNARSWFRLTSDDAGANATEVGAPTMYDIELAEDLTGDLALPASALLGDEETGWAFDARTTNPNNMIVRNAGTPALDFEGPFATFITDDISPVPYAGETYTVYDQDGVSRTTTAGEVPYTYEGGVRSVIVEADSNFKIPEAKVGFTDEYTIWGVASRRSTGADALATMIGLAGDATTKALTIGTFDGTPDVWTAGYFNPAATSTTSILGDAEQLGEEIFPFVIRAKAGEHAISIRNQPFMPMSWVGTANANFALQPAFTPYEIAIGEAGEFRLLYVAGVARAIPDDELVTIPEYAPYIKASLPIALFRESYAIDNGGRARAPNTLIIDDGTTSGTASWLSVCEQREASNDDGETPRRIVGRFMQYEEGATELTRTDLYPFVQPAGWATGMGDFSHPVLGKRTYGPHAGRATMLFAYIEGQDVVGVEIDNAIWSIAYVESDDNFREILTGDMTPTVIMAAGVNAGDFIVPSPGGMLVEFPQGSTYSGRQFVSIVTNSASLGTGPRIMYRDQGGAWTLGAVATGVPAGPGVTEWWAALGADGVIYGFGREDSGEVDSNDNTVVLKSTDGGATVTYVQHLDQTDGFTGPYGPMRVIQLDPDGEGIGRIAVVRAAQGTGTTSLGMKVTHFETDAFALLDEYEPLLDYLGTRTVTYDPLFGGSRFLLTYEQGDTGNLNHRASCFAAIVKPPA